MDSLPYPLSRSSAGLRRSVMRDLMAIAVSPEIISFAGGLPAADCLPIRQIEECLDAVLTRDGAWALQYGPPYGPLREWLAGYMRARGVACTTEDIFITSGAQQGLEILSRLFADPGDTAVVEAITFTGVRQVVEGRGLTPLTVPTDLGNGVELDALRDRLTRTPAPRLAILIPNFHNPLGVSIAAESRPAIAELAARCRVPVIEDDPYAPLNYDGDPLPPIKSYDDSDGVLYVGSFSKMLAPAMRLGWIVAPAALVPKITVLREAMDLESSQLIQRAVAEFCLRGHLEPHLANLRAVNRVRRDAMLSALDRHMAPHAQGWTRPNGGLFLWVTLREGIDATDLFRAALAQNVAYIPGASFALNGGHRNTMRLNFSNVRPERIEEGIARLGEVIREQMG